MPAPPPYPLHPEPMKRSWMERHPLWKIPLGILTLLLMIAIFGSVVAAIMTTMFRHSEPYQVALQRASQNAQVRALIGEPLQPDWLISGELQVSGSTGHASFLIPIRGPRNGGRIRVVAQKSGGLWSFSCLQVEVRGRGGSINLLADEAVHGDD